MKRKKKGIETKNKAINLSFLKKVGMEIKNDKLWQQKVSKKRVKMKTK